MLGSNAPGEKFAWSRLYADTLALRQTLAAVSANLALAALRGVLRESWRLGLVSQEDLQRAIYLALVQGDRVRPRPEIKPTAIRRLLKSAPGIVHFVAAATSQPKSAASGNKESCHEGV